MAEGCRNLFSTVARKANNKIREAISQRGAGGEANLALAKLNADSRDGLGTHEHSSSEWTGS